MTKLKIKVTKEVLRESAGCSPECSYVENCAIAVAVRDIFPEAMVGLTIISPFYCSETAIQLPYAAVLYVSAFDGSDYEQRLSMPEIDFEIEIPDSVIDKINIDEIRPLLVNHPTLELV